MNGLFQEVEFAQMRKDGQGICGEGEHFGVHDGDDGVEVCIGGGGRRFHPLRGDYGERAAGVSDAENRIFDVYDRGLFSGWKRAGDRAGKSFLSLCSGR